MDIIERLDQERGESFYEWHKREKRNPKLAKELNDLFDFF